MNALINHILFLLLILSLCCCRKEKAHSNLVTFDVGFEELKNYQGVCNNNGEEEVYFYRTGFKPLVKFYDLEGNLKDTFSLQQVEDQIGLVGLFSTTSRDTMFVMSYRNNQLTGVDRNGNSIFRINLDSLCSLTEEDKYGFIGNFIPSPFYIGNSVIFTLIWDGKYNEENESASTLDYYQFILKSRMHSPVICKVEPIYNGSPKVSYALRNHYYKRSSELTSYGLSEKNFAILNKKLFLILSTERNLFELDLNTLNVVDTIPVIPEKYDIPSGIKLIAKPGISEDKMARQELMDKCRIINMLYSKSKKQYYIFLKTGKDYSIADELGYPFNVYIYDEQFVKTGERSFDNDLYNPKTAMMTSKGIMIEKTIKDQPYGKKTFEFFDL